MKINLQAKDSYVMVTDKRIDPANPFITRDGFQYYRLCVDKNSQYRAMFCCHELGHVLLCRTERVGKRDPLSIVKSEIMAWRLAMSFCQPRYWNEQEAKESIRAHFEGLDNWLEICQKVGFENLKITPVNRGISLRS